MAVETRSLSREMAMVHDTGTVQKPHTESLTLCTCVSTMKCHPTLTVATFSAVQLLLSPSWMWVSYYVCYSEVQIVWKEENGV